MTERIINIDGHDVRFRSSAAIPRIYRIKFERDIFSDMQRLEQSMTQQAERVAKAAEANPSLAGKDLSEAIKDVGSDFPIEDLSIFENVAYAMAYHADNSIAPNIDEWLEQFGMFSIYEIMPDLIDLWRGNTKVLDNAKKKPAANGQGADHGTVSPEVH